MSFWTKIGLADKKMISELHTEIVLLREENKTLLKQSEDTLAECQKRNAESVLEAISRATSDIIDKLSQIECQSKANVALVEGLYKSVIEEMNAMGDCVEKSLRQEVSSSTQRVVSKINDKIDTIGRDTISRDTASLDQVMTSLSECSHSIIMMKEAVERLDANGKEQLKEIINKQLEMVKKMDDADGLNTEVVEIRNTLSNLWSIMKVVFVDSVLTELDHSV